MQPPHGAGDALRVAVMVCALVIAGAAPAQPQPASQPASPPTSSTMATKPGGPSWTSLSRPQKEALAPLQKEWASIDADRKSKWLEIASRFPSMPLAERQRVQERMTDWSRLTPNQRGQARLQFQESRQHTAEDRQARWDAYRALPEETRREFAQRAKPAAGTPPLPGSSAASNKLAASDSKAPAPARKGNLVRGADSGSSKPVSPIVLQAKPGATTTLVSRTAAPPNHHQPGLPKIAATEGFVHPSTLLPKRGAQGAAMRTTAAASEPKAGP